MRSFNEKKSDVYEKNVDNNSNQSPAKVKALIKAQIDRINTIAAYRSVRIDIDVDPM